MNRIEINQAINKVAELLDNGDATGARAAVEGLLDEFSCKDKSEYEKKAGYNLSDNQYLFCCEAEAMNLTIDFSYSGRCMVGETCPAVRVEDARNFHAYVRMEGCGRSRIVQYAEY